MSRYRRHYRMVILIILFNIMMISGCWNYKEVEDWWLVSGTGIDYDSSTEEYILTVEVIKNTEEEGVDGEIFQTKGKSVFDSIRNIINKVGRKLYWTHSDLLIIGKDTAEKGIIPFLDLMNRNHEVNRNMFLSIANEETAEVILSEGKDIPSTKVNSFRIFKAITQEKGISKYHGVFLWQAVKCLSEEGISLVLPMVSLNRDSGKQIAQISGAAVFKGDKMIGELNEDETKFYMMATDQLKGGLFVLDVTIEKKPVTVTLEIFKNKTKIKPEKIKDNLVIKLNTETTVQIAEIAGVENVIDKKGREILQKEAEKMIEASIENVIAKVQNEYNSDIFGFGRIIKDTMPDVWRVKGKDAFKSLKTQVHSKIIIQGSSLLSEPLKVGD